NISKNKAMEAELKAHHSELEEQVRQRTLSLQSTVQQLQQEVRTRKSAEHQLRLLVEKAEKNVQVKSEFIANMNHELRTPLNAIIGFSDLLREGLVGPLSETQIDYINDIFDSGNRLLHLISDIMDLSKIESGMVELEPESVIFNDVLQNSLGMVKSKALNHHIQLSSDIDPSIETVVLDVRKVKQLLFNLLSNAVKFTPSEGSVNVIVGLQDQMSDAPLLTIAIHDTGIGISEDDVPKLFESFVQLDGSIDRHFEGTGLGLSLVKQLVDLHGGIVEVSSQLGVGSCFTVKLPYRTDEASDIV
ncbi:MAG: ATP-binding protein, partial [Mariprofundaceae bacterium]|nr:ATP-binding protein [Mariprofundaceae bacterium]